MTTYIQNRKARFDFDILETVEAGLVLFGFEVKSIRTGKVKLEGSYVIIRGDEAFLVGATISPYQAPNTPKSYEADRARKLLLSKKEITELKRQSETERLTIVPIRLYNNGRNIKLEIGVARGKKKHDKRESLKARDSKRDIERTLKNQY